MAFAVELESVWKEYEEGKTKEAQLVRDIDVYERLVQAKEYEVRERGEKDLGDFFVQWEEIITTSEIKRWTEFLLRERETFWSRKKASAVIIFVLGMSSYCIGLRCFSLDYRRPWSGKRDPMRTTSPRPKISAFVRRGSPT